MHQGHQQAWERCSSPVIWKCGRDSKGLGLRGITLVPVVELLQAQNINTAFLTAWAIKTKNRTTISINNLALDDVLRFGQEETKNHSERLGQLLEEAHCDHTKNNTLQIPTLILDLLMTTMLIQCRQCWYILHLPIQILLPQPVSPLFNLFFHIRQHYYPCRSGCFLCLHHLASQFHHSFAYLPILHVSFNSYKQYSYIELSASNTATTTLTISIQQSLD